MKDETILNIFKKLVKRPKADGRKFSYTIFGDLSTRRYHRLHHQFESVMPSVLVYDGCIHFQDKEFLCRSKL